MSTLSITSGNSLATVGISSATPGYLPPTRRAGTDGTSSDNTAKDDKKTAQASADKELSPDEKRRVAELKSTDAAVRAHEQTHINVGRDLITSGPNYTYTYGPDGQRYAVAGEVGIDTSPEREPQANIDKGQHIQDTALAPADPSPQDYSVAATGRKLEESGRTDLREQRKAEQQDNLDARLRAYVSGTEEKRQQLDVFA